MERLSEGHYRDLVAGHDVNIDRHRVGQWAGWWTLFVDGEWSGWYYRTKQEAVDEIDRCVDAFIRKCMGVYELRGGA